MSLNDEQKEIVLKKLAANSNYKSQGRSKYLINNEIVHVRFCSFDKRDNSRFKFNINPNTLSSDYELWICGSSEIYYLMPIKILKEIYENPNTYIDRHHPEIRVVSLNSRENKVVYASGGQFLDLTLYKNKTFQKLPIKVKEEYNKVLKRDEGQAHLRLKNWIAENPWFCDLHDVVKTEIETHQFPSGDLPDIVFHLSSGTIVSVEIETTNPLPGAYQALKYRTLLCAENDFDLSSDKVETVLVAWEIPSNIQMFCERYGIKYYEKKI